MVFSVVRQNRRTASCRRLGGRAMFLNPVMNFCMSCDISCALGSLIFRKKICIAPFILDGGGTCAPGAGLPIVCIAFDRLLEFFA